MWVRTTGPRGRVKITRSPCLSDHGNLKVIVAAISNRLPRLTDVLVERFHQVLCLLVAVAWIAAEVEVRLP